MILSQEKGASNWLTVLPVEEFGLALHKGAFRDALACTPIWVATQLQPHARVAPTSQWNMRYHVQKGHNEIRDFNHRQSEVCHNVAIEPHLQPITAEILSGASANTQDGARLDVAADGF